MLVWSLAVASARKPPPGPQVLEAVTADQIAAALQNAGFRAEVSTEGPDVLVITSMAGRGVHLTGYDCDEAAPRRCRSVHFLYGEEDAWSTTAETVNLWNQNKRYAQGVLATGAVVQLSMDMQFFGGATLANLEANVRTFDGLVGEFVVFLEQHRGAPPAPPAP